MTKKILITGGAGYIGSTVALNFIDNGYDVTIIDNLSTGNRRNIPSKAKFILTDIANQAKVSKILKETKFDLIIHFAAYIRVAESLKFPKKYLENNYEKTKIFLNNCLNHGLNKIIFSSTAAVYGDQKKKKYKENNKLKPQNPYSLSKQKVENIIIRKSKTHNLKYIILRYFNVAGTEPKMRSGLISKKSTHLIKICCEVFLGKKKNLIINGNDYSTPDGTPIRDYIHISDLAEIHKISAEALMKNGKSNIFNCGYGYGYSVKEIVDFFPKYFNKRLSFKIGPRRKSDIKCIVANSEKFKKHFNWKPKYNNLKKIILSSLLWEKKFK